MSGSSFQYLCYQDAHKLGSGQYLQELQRMHKALVAMNATEAAQATLRVLNLLEYQQAEIEKAASQMHDVWHAVEWFHSGDYGEEKCQEILEKWKRDRYPVVSNPLDSTRAGWMP